MRKLLLIILLSVLFSAIYYAQTATVISENANLRGTPSQSGKVVDTLEQNSQVEVIKQRGVWFLVQSSDYVGWMHGNTLRPNSSLKVADAPIYTAPRITAPARRSQPTRTRTTESRFYIRGPRGGCYYINGNGNKTYVSRSLCS